MNKDELPALYQDLADLRIDQQKGIPVSGANPVIELHGFRFVWGATPEGFIWWNEVIWTSSDVQNLPSIPESSIQELIDLNITSTGLDPVNPMTPITDTHGDLLPEPYQSLAQEQKKTNPMVTSLSNKLEYSFSWADTIQGYDWWSEVNYGGEPEIPFHDSCPTKEEKPEPKKHSTMEDVFIGMNRHAKKENSKKENSKKDFTKQDKGFFDELDALFKKRFAGPE